MPTGVHQTGHWYIRGIGECGQPVFFKFLESSLRLKHFLKQATCSLPLQGLVRIHDKPKPALSWNCQKKFYSRAIYHMKWYRIICCYSFSYKKLKTFNFYKLCQIENDSQIVVGQRFRLSTKSASCGFRFQSRGAQTF